MVKMNPEYAPLFTPWKIGAVEIKNRIVLCPMGGTSLFGWMEPNHFDEEAAAFFLDRAKQNVGLIIPGIAPVRDTMGGRWLWQNRRMFEQLKPFMEQIHRTGAKLFVQITAGMGRSWAITTPLVAVHNNPVLRALCKPFVDVQYQSASPSELPSRWSDKVVCRQITTDEIRQIVDGFAKTARLCRDAGVDGVEVHAVHEGYLLDQFTLPYTNRRDDEYGGSFENRYRFATDIVRAIKAACGVDFPVSLRYSVVSKTKGFCYGALPGETYEEIGRDLTESERAARYLQDAGYDMLNADNGTYDAWYWAHPPQYMPENCNLEEVAHIRRFVDIPVVCAGRMDPAVGAKAIAEGRIDALGVARQFLADGEWVTKLLENRLEEIRPCICCHNGCFNLTHYRGVANDQSLYDAGHMARCALNPPTMQRGRYRIEPAARRKRVAVVGGGIGGMETALVAAQRGHSVTLYEKSDRLGGVFIAAAAPSFKEKDRALIAWYRRAVASQPGITVRLNTEVRDVASLDADEIVVATGAQARKLPVRGISRAMDAVDYLLGRPVGRRVVVVGGGLTGCEIAYDLYGKGHEPVILEMKDDLIAVRGVCLANASYLRDFFRTNRVPVHLETRLGEVLEDGVTAVGRDGRAFKIEADSVILSVGYAPAPLPANGRRIRLVGDAKAVGNLRTVIWGAWDVAMRL